jgi:hypothetical protein
MKESLKDDIRYFALGTLITVLFLVVGYVYSVGFNHMSDKEKEDIIILQMMNQQ